jgi:DNA-binding GntR family transcriptional regulator
MGPVEYEQIMQWQRGTMRERVAADLASRIKSGNLTKWGELPLNRTLADQWDVSQRTVSSAKKLLADNGLLTKVDTRYYVA